MNEPTERSQSSTTTSDDNGEFQQHVRDYSHAASRWVSASLTRDSIVAGLKTLIWLVPLTVLIWIYAEREQIDKPSPEAIPIQIRSSDPNRIVEPLMGGSSVIAKLNGPKSSIEALRREIQLQANGEPSVVILIPSSYSVGRQELDTVQLLMQTKQFASSGVTIESCQPERLKVDIDEYVDREAEVQPPTQFQHSLDPQQTSFSPDKVKVRGPSRSEPPKDVKLVVYADLSKLPDISQPGEKKGDVLVAAPAWKGSQVSPTSVKVSLVSRPPELTYEINTMTIKVQETPNMLMDERKRVKLENNQLTRVPVSGPPEQIEFLRKEIESAPDTAVAYAILRLERKDLFKTTSSSVRLEFRFPKGAEGVRVDPNYDYAKKDFEFTIVPDQP